MAKKIQKSNMTQTDGKGKVIREPKPDHTDDPRNFMWWTLKDDEEALARSAVATCDFIQHHQNSRMEQLTVSTRLYGNTSAYNLLGTAFTRANSVNSNPFSQRMSFNICASVTDTLTSMIAKNKIVPTYITEGGVWGMQSKAEKLSKFTEGCFYQNDIHSKGTSAFRDACVWGDGFIHIFEGDEDDICTERVLPHELFVDNIEALATNPTQLHRVKYTDRDIAIANFPKHGEYLRTAMPVSPQDIGGSGTAAQLIVLVESWHLRSGPKAKDGLHVICCGDQVLFKEEWAKDYFPFAQISYSKRLLGWFGQGICERLQNIQGEINRNMILVQKCFWLGGSFKVLLENGSKVVSQHINNDVGAIIHYTGTPPQYITPPMVQPEIITYIDNLIDKGYRQEGISQMSAAGTRPAAELSGKALREMNENEQDRFMYIEQEVEKFYLEIARQMIEVAKDIYSRKKSFKVVYPDTKFMETIDWGEIKLKEDQYVLKAFPTSSLPDDPSGKLQTIQEYMQAGLISPRAGRRLMAMPDVEMSDNLANASEDLLHKIFEEMLNKGKYRAPEPFFDLQLAQQLGIQYYNYADLNNCPEERLSLIRRFLAQVNDITGVNAPPPAAPQAAPNPPAQSNLIPNVPQAQAS